MKGLMILGYIGLGFSLISCGGSSGSSSTSLDSSYKSVSSATPANLSTSEENALSATSSNVSSSSLGAYNNSQTGFRTALIRDVSKIALGTKISPSTASYNDTLTQTTNCTDGGSVEVDATISGRGTQTDNEIDIDVSISGEADADNCQEEDATVDGTLTTSANFSVNASGDNIENATLVFAFEISGTITASGKNDADEFENFRITFNDYGVGMDLNFQEAVNDLVAIQNSEDSSTQVSTMLDWIQCKGSVTVENLTLNETNTYDCDAMMKTLMEEA